MASNDMFEPELILKATPPRMPRSALERERLARFWADVRDRTAITVVAPAGFGKTTLMAQWRRRWLEQGALVAWLSVDGQDEPTRFTLALLHALRVASGRPSFEEYAAQCQSSADGGIAAMTGLLAEIAYIGVETVLIIDEAERLPESTLRISLAYLLRNAPANLHVLIGSRLPLPLRTWELAAKANFAALKVEDLRLRLDESTAILVKRFDRRLGLDDCARLHEATEGWPIGLQLAAAAVEREPDPTAAIRSLSARSGDIAHYFIESLFSRLPAELGDFLIRIAMLERMNAELCEAVTGSLLAADYLEQLMLDTPILIGGELQDWVRMHPLARDFLLSRFEKLSVEEREILQCRAYHWFAKRNRFHEAACHALAAGDHPAAQSHAARALWTLGTQGRLAEARVWLDMIPETLFDEDVELRLIGAWIIALGDRSDEALAIAMQALQDPAATPRTRVIATRVAAGAAGYADRLGLIPDIFKYWPTEASPMVEPVYALAYENPLALLALHAGDTDEVRRRVCKAPPAGDTDCLPLALAFGRILAAASHLWDGDASRAEAEIRPALLEAERSDGRRSMVASLYAAVLAAALLERDQLVEAQSLLAHRLDVIERIGFPDTILFAYRTLAYLALSQGDERRALNILDNLQSLADQRNLPRIGMYCLSERIRIHALRACTETVDALMLKFDALAPKFEQHDLLPFKLQYQLAGAIAKTYSALARHDVESAEQALAEADRLATQSHRRRDAITIKVLRAVAARQRNATNALPLLAEALSLAAIGGNARLLADTHPLALQMTAELRGTHSVPMPRAMKPGAGIGPVIVAARPPLARSGPLTPKEAEILRLLDGGMSNKLIARTLEISDETVKWHLKNLFSKLSAGTRKHVVDRARLLGLIGA
jgi:LuxR family maltose regulon positive regulatory protein